MISGFPEKREFDDTSSVSSIRRSRRSGRRLQVWINIVFRCNRSFLASSCTQELQALFGCLKKWEFDDTPCGKQHPAYMDCVHTAQRAAAEFKEVAKKVSFVIVSMFWHSSLLWSSCFHFFAHRERLEKEGNARSRRRIPLIAQWKGFRHSSMQVIFSTQNLGKTSLARPFLVNLDSLQNVHYKDILLLQMAAHTTFNVKRKLAYA